MSRNNGGAQKRARNRLQRPGEVSTVCMWCGEVIYWLNMIPSEHILKVGHTFANIQINGHRKQLLLATVDHYLEQRYGGTNEPRNLIPSCAVCNRGRSAETKSRPDACVDCGGQKKGYSRRRCKSCVIQRRDEHFAALNTRAVETA